MVEQRLRSTKVADCVRPQTSYVIIPARLGSTRLPRKLLLRDTGIPLIQHTYEGACGAKLPRGTCVATDHPDIFRAVRRFGGEVVMTSPNHQSGTDRVAEAARNMQDVDIIVNVQGDEPEISGAAIDRLIRLLEENPHVPVGTLAAPIDDAAKLTDRACVKVVFDAAGRALYFSRSPIPACRAGVSKLLEENPGIYYQHIGVYAYRRDFLFHFAELPESRLERIEKLEQLRVLETGHSILVELIAEATLGIDTPEDYAAFVDRVRFQRAEMGTPR